MLLLLLVSAFVASLKFIQISDTHVGSHKRGEEKSALQYLTDLVVVVNQLALDDPTIRFVVITGDITEDGDQAALDQTKSALTGLTIPYFPLLGNHDVWLKSGTVGSEEPLPRGDFRLMTTFSAQLNHSSVVNSTAFTPVLNPGISASSYLINYQFEFDRVVFLACDWNSRTEALYGGAIAAASDNAFTGGTLEWLTDRIRVLADRDPATFDRVVLLQHHPFHIPFLAVTTGKTQYTMGFMDNELQHISDALSSGGSDLLAKMGVDFSGHLHEFYVNKAPLEDVGLSRNQWREYVTEDSATGHRYAIVSYTGPNAYSAVGTFGVKWVGFDWLHRDWWIIVIVGGGVAVVMAVFGLCCLGLICVSKIGKSKKKQEKKEDVELS